MNIMKVIALNEEQAAYIRERIEKIRKNIASFYTAQQTFIDDDSFLLGIQNSIEVQDVRA